MPQTNRFFAVFRIIKSGKIGKNRKNVKFLTFGKVADFWHFFLMYKVFYDFFKNSFNKLLDFFGKCARAHTMRAFKLGTVQKQISTPEISAVNGTTNGKGILLNTQTL